MRAMESAGVVRTLAEPNLTAISGESATFIAGGEFPDSGRVIPAIRYDGRSARRRLSYKKFGISLNFTPVVLTEGRISLRVMTEVSELSTDNSITLNQAGKSLTVPFDQDPPRRDHAGNSVRRLDGDGRPDPGADQAGRQRLAGARLSCRCSARCSGARISSTTRPN